MRPTWITITAAVLAGCTSAVAMTGKGAVVVSKAGVEIANSSKLILCTITDDRTTARDTILEDGEFYYPTFSFDGTRIAFYRKGSGLCVIDADGGNLRALDNNTVWTATNMGQFINWPGADDGKWIYYHGKYGGNSGDIWKVNVDDTTQRSLVCDYTRNGGGVERFQLSTDARYAVVHAVGTETSVGWPYGYDRNDFMQVTMPHTFPPLVDQSTGWIDPGLTKASCEVGCPYRAGCNAGISTSGAILWHFDGTHAFVFAWEWDHAANSTVRMTTGTGVIGSFHMDSDMGAWLKEGPGMGESVCYPRATANSDQILSIQSVWSYSNAYVLNAGSNQVFANWKDKESVMPSSNPDLRDAGGIFVPNGTAYAYCEPGDFWLSGGPEGCYEDVNGDWIDVETGGMVKAVPGSISRVRAFRAGPAEIYTLTGARIGVVDARGTTRRMPAHIRNGACVMVDNNAAARRLIHNNGLLSR